MKATTVLEKMVKLDALTPYCSPEIYAGEKFKGPLAEVEAAQAEFSDPSGPLKKMEGFLG
eukprot:7091623-Alexandrium_andersonii.AAC.1